MVYILKIIPWQYLFNVTFHVYFIAKGSLALSERTTDLIEDCQWLRQVAVSVSE